MYLDANAHPGLHPGYEYGLVEPPGASRAGSATAAREQAHCGIEGPDPADLDDVVVHRQVR